MAEVLRQEDWFCWSLNQLSREFGLARETVSRRLSDAGVASAGERRGHPVYKVGAAARAILLSQQKSFSSISDPDSLAPKDRLDHFRSENERIKLEKETGLLVHVEDARAQMAEIAKTGLQILETLPDILERDFQLDADIIEALEAKIDALRNNWAESLSQ